MEEYGIEKYKDPQIEQLESEIIDNRKLGTLVNK